MERKPFKLFCVVVVLTFLGGCHPEGPEYVEELDAVYTNYNPEFNFSNQNTFALPDSIVLINDQNFIVVDGEETPETVDPVYADVILTQIRDNMTANGWTEVENTDDPDVVLFVSATRTTNLYYNYDWRYWDWWYPGAFSGYGWYYPNFYPGFYGDYFAGYRSYRPGYVTGYRSGTLLIQMAQPSKAGVNDNVPVVWMSIINGLLEGSTENINNRLVQTIDQAFEQSPYLNERSNVE